MPARGVRAPGAGYALYLSPAEQSPGPAAAPPPSSPAPAWPRNPADNGQSSGKRQRRVEGG